MNHLMFAENRIGRRSLYLTEEALQPKRGSVVGIERERGNEVAKLMVLL